MRGRPVFVAVASVIVFGTRLRGSLVKCMGCGFSIIIRDDAPSNVDLRLHECPR